MATTALGLLAAEPRAPSLYDRACDSMERVEKCFDLGPSQRLCFFQAARFHERLMGGDDVASDAMATPETLHYWGELLFCLELDDLQWEQALLRIQLQLARLWGLTPDTQAFLVQRAPARAEHHDLLFGRPLQLGGAACVLAALVERPRVTSLKQPLGEVRAALPTLQQAREQLHECLLTEGDVREVYHTLYHLLGLPPPANPDDPHFVPPDVRPHTLVYTFR